MSHCVLLQSEELQVIVGDASRNGVGGTQYCGLWSLASRHWPFNAFGNSYAGLIPGLIRGKAPQLEIRSETSAVLWHRADEDWPVDVEATYALHGSCRIDHTLTFTDRRDMRPAGATFREASWCSYINSPEDPRLHIRSGGNWTSYLSPRHGLGSNLAPAYVPDAELEQWPPRTETRPGQFEPFHWDRATVRFDEPHYWGRIGPMVLIHVFDTPRWLRFFCSPSGGGASLRPGETCPAWDFEWVIPAAEYRINHPFTFRMSLIYKPFVSNDEVRDACQRAADEQGFERA